MNTPVAGFIIGASVGGLAAVPISLAGYWSESLGLAITAGVAVLVFPISLVVALFTATGYRLGRSIADGRHLGDRASVAVGSIAAAVFGALLFAGCLVVLGGSLASILVAPIAVAVVGSVAGALCDLSLTVRASRRSVPAVVPLESD